MNIAIFGSGGGSNAEVIIKTLNSFIEKEAAEIAVVITNNENAAILKIADTNQIPSEFIDIKHSIGKNYADLYFKILKQYKIDFIILAGYLKKLPQEITAGFQKKIINIHPALLPLYGGAGMYGKYVHEAVIAAKEKQSGITIHYVDEVYDHGKIIFQAQCLVESTDTADILAKKILALEHKYYTSIIAEVLLSQIPVK